MIKLHDTQSPYEACRHASLSSFIILQNMDGRVMSLCFPCFHFIRSRDHIWGEEGVHRIWEVLEDVWLQWGKRNHDGETEGGTWLLVLWHLMFVLCCMLQLDLTFHLFVCALAGAGAAVIAMVRTIIFISDGFGPGVLIGTDFYNFQPAGSPEHLLCSMPSSIEDFMWCIFQSKH